MSDHIDPGEAYILEFKPTVDPLKRNHGINRAPIYRLKRVLKYAKRHEGFRSRWTRLPPSVELEDRELTDQPMVRFLDGPAGGQMLMLRRAPIYLRVTFDGVWRKWDACDQVDDIVSAGETVWVYKRLGAASVAFLDWVERGRRRGGRFAFGTYQLVVDAPDEETVRDNERWQAWCWSQVKCPQPGLALVPTESEGL
jgi:hypothetical protein